ncbi:hypothetical protein DFH08DRAFT_716955, partial [Mycena albidolilacea]
KTLNPIYYFFEKVDCAADGLQMHLQSHFLAHYRLFKVLSGRGGPPTEVELALARGSTPMTPETAAQYLERLDAISNSIKDMFKKQAAASEASETRHPRFEDLLAKWVAACDQPFSVVDGVEFRELLKYAHHPAPTELKIPSSRSIKNRIGAMEEEMIAGLTRLFEVGCDFTLV